MTITRRGFVIGSATAASLMVAVPAQAIEPKPFDQKAFDMALKTGKSILIEITAPWCPTCKAQKPILSELTRKSKFKDMQVFEVDFDTQKDIVRRFKAQAQSTLIAFKGEREVGRSVGDTNRGSIEDLLNKSI